MKTKGIEKEFMEACPKKWNIECTRTREAIRVKVTKGSHSRGIQMFISSLELMRCNRWVFVKDLINQLTKEVN